MADADLSVSERRSRPLRAANWMQVVEIWADAPYEFRIVICE